MITRLFEIDDLRVLTGRRQRPCVSLYLPTHRAGRQETQGDPIRLKNAIARAKERLGETGYPKDAAAALLAPAAGLVTSREFWLERTDGLALFLAPGLFRYYRLPLKFRDEVVVADHFSLRQLIPLLSQNGHFYILALSQKRVRVFEATRTSIQEQTVPDMPAGIADLKRFDEAQAQVQGHTLNMPGAAGRTDMVFHGQGNIADKATYKADVLQYVTAVCKKLEKFLNGRTAPLVVAAVEYEQAFYRQVSSYRNLLEPGILGNPDGLDEGQLHRAAWEIVEPWFDEARRTELRHFGDLSNTDKTSDRLEEILPAARRGRVRTLYLQTQAHAWGKFDGQESAVEVHDTPVEGDTDLIDLATSLVLRHKGLIYALPPDQMPARSPVAAMFRY